MAAPLLNASMAGRPSPLTGERPAPRAVDWLRKGHARLGEKFDISRCRHKPLSILRQEGRRALEQYFESESTGLGRADREALTETILQQAIGFSLLEELFRDDSISEVQILDAHLIVAKKQDAWMPTSVRFRNPAELRACATIWSETGRAVEPGLTMSGGFAVRFGNGFRCVGLLPPEGIEHPPMILFLREGAKKPGSSTIDMAATQRTGLIPTNSITGIAGIGTTPAPMAMSAASRVMKAPDLGPPPPPVPAVDPYAKLRKRAAHWIVSRCAAAGVYDLSTIPSTELQKVLNAHIVEVCEQEMITIDPATVERLVLEILVGMNR